MKIAQNLLIMLLTVILIDSNAYAKVFQSSKMVKSQDKMICSIYYVYKYEAQVRKLENDKQMHCSMSCMIARKCGTLESTAIGYIKEIVDVFTSGTPDRQDIVANKKGIKYSKRAKNNKACINYCKKIYPKL